MGSLALVAIIAIVVETFESPPDPPRPSEPASEFDRKGGLAGVGVGVTGCGQPDCFDMVVAGLGHVELGYRFGIPAIVVEASLGGAKTTPPSDAQELDSNALFFDAGVGLALFPVRHGRVDPFIAATLGYARMRWQVSSEWGGTSQAWHSRGAVRLGTGFNFYVTQKIALGPRVDITLPFAGKLCSEDPDGTRACRTITALIDEGINREEQRSIRRSFARPWSATLNLHIFFG